MFSGKAKQGLLRSLGDVETHFHCYCTIFLKEVGNSVDSITITGEPADMESHVSSPAVSDLSSSGTDHSSGPRNASRCSWDQLFQKLVRAGLPSLEGPGPSPLIPSSLPVSTALGEGRDCLRCRHCVSQG